MNSSKHAFKEFDTLNDKLISFLFYFKNFIVVIRLSYFFPCPVLFYRFPNENTNDGII